MRFLRFVWKLFVMASVFGIGYIIGREHSFEEEEMWEDEAEKKEAKDDSKPACSGCGDNEVEFEFEDADAKKVSIVGNFNDWNKDANPMKLENGIWKCTLKLKPGKHEYQFVVNDTDWIVDPKSGTSVKNKYEGMNSVIEIK
ncbi:MAG TPA: isoamylase early set domain-containing protein [Candidatus Rifleibacterium sp.]|nr:isoamylase early set domain-containing protein [Candidatus Rifleibacterium sp.]HNW09788.1 isoamylase early set domain-containing protein [Candidatus Rifleibacterium sp.]HOI89259.1 isoamylase early set domain-containing protein [Candidatus Rifleibacterium sp.]HPW59988.1 isoamylase early set domain-containing protein [Candidatus Rifleibacterium sp.]